MHVLLIHQAFASLDEPGGTRHHELARCLAEEGHCITIIASPVSYLTGVAADRSSPEPKDPNQGVVIHRVYTFPALHRSFVHRVFSFLSFMVSSFIAGMRAKEVDLVWGTSPPIFQGLTAWLVARLKGVPFLFEVRDLWPDFAIAVGILRNPALIRASFWLERFLYRNADRVVVNSPGFIDHVKTKGGRQARLIPNGSDPRMFHPSAHGESFRSAHRLEGKFVVMYAGAHGLSNDLDTLLDAADHLREHPQMTIVLLGDGKEKPTLLRRAAQMGLANVVFLPPVPKQDMAQALAAADACVAILKPVPLYATVYPNKVFDYMAAARPVLLVIDGVIKEVITSAQAGIPVPPGNASVLAEAILELYKHPERARQMGQNGRDYVETHFDRAALARELLSIMHEMKPKNHRERK